MKTKPKPTKAGDAVLASSYKITTRTVRNWRADGAPLHDPQKMELWLAARNRVPAGLEPVTLTDARLHKTLAETRRINFELAVRRGEYLLVEDMKRERYAAGCAVRAALTRIPNEAGGWEGLPAATMQKKCQAIVDDILTELSKPATYDRYNPLS